MVDDRLGVAGKAVVVAGAGGGGIGTAVCAALVEVGARVVGLDVDGDALTATAQAVAAAGAEWTPVVVDVRDAAGVEQAVAAIDGDVLGLVHVAGGLRPDRWASVLATPPELFTDIVELNLISAFVTSRAVAARLTAQAAGGSVVHVASIAGLSSMPYGAGYASAKAGLMALTRTAALEWGPAGIRVNAVAPGTIRTPRSQKKRADEETEEERVAIPLRRRGRPSDIADAALFLLSDLSSFVSGHVLVVDGGSSVRPSYLDADDLPVFVRDAELRARLAAPGA